MLWCWMDMHLDEVRELGRAVEIRQLSTEYAMASPLSIQGVISFRRTWATHLSPRFSSRNRSTVEGA
jgi:hypothetical protein